MHYLKGDVRRQDLGGFVLTASLTCIIRRQLPNRTHRRNYYRFSLPHICRQLRFETIALPYTLNTIRFELRTRSKAIEIMAPDTLSVITKLQLMIGHRFRHVEVGVPDFGVLKELPLLHELHLLVPRGSGWQGRSVEEWKQKLLK